MLKRLSVRDGFLFAGLALAGGGVAAEWGLPLALVAVGAVLAAVGLVGAWRAR